MSFVKVDKYPAAVLVHKNGMICIHCFSHSARTFPDQNLKLAEAVSTAWGTGQTHKDCGESSETHMRCKRAAVVRGMARYEVSTGDF